MPMTIQIDVSILTMRLSDGREEYYVQISRDGRECTIGYYKQPYYNRALYERDTLRHVLLGWPKPRLLEDQYADPT